MTSHQHALLFILSLNLVIFLLFFDTTHGNKRRAAFALVDVFKWFSTSEPKWSGATPWVAPRCCCCCCGFSLGGSASYKLHGLRTNLHNHQTTSVADTSHCVSTVNTVAPGQLWCPAAVGHRSETLRKTSHVTSSYIFCGRRKEEDEGEESFVGQVCFIHMGMWPVPLTREQWSQQCTLWKQLVFLQVHLQRVWIEVVRMCAVFPVSSLFFWIFPMKNLIIQQLWPAANIKSHCPLVWGIICHFLKTSKALKTPDRQKVRTACRQWDLPTDRVHSVQQHTSHVYR